MYQTAARQDAYTDSRFPAHAQAHRADRAAGAAPYTITSLLRQRAANDVPYPGLVAIRAADSQHARSAAGILIDRMYGTRGYRTNGLPAQGADDRVTLTAGDDEQVLGTITVGSDTSDGLFVDQLFSEEVDALRRGGHSVCEFTKLAVDGMVRSRNLLASLFHVAYIHARKLRGHDHVLIEVNPRHVRYYEGKLGFVARSEERLNPRVNAPAVLMGLDLAHAEEQIERFGGKQDAVNERSLYPYFYSPAEERGIVARLMRRS